MDALILTFNKKQLNTYKELLNKESIELSFDTSLQEFDKFYIISFDEILSNIENEAKILLSFNKQNSTFSAFFSQEEIKKLTPVYYDTIKEIRHNSNIISGQALKLSIKLGEIDKALANIHKRYADFLPYKAALYNTDKYTLEIKEIDEKFKDNINILNDLKYELLEMFKKAQNLSNIVEDFIQKSSKATDEPKFKNFNAHDFFWSLEAFIQQIKNISN